MIKGVNRCILEVGSSESKYFERALLFVRPEYADISQKTLQDDAKKYVTALDGDIFVKRNRASELRRARLLLKAVIAVVVIAALVGYTLFVRSL